MKMNFRGKGLAHWLIAISLSAFIISCSSSRRTVPGAEYGWDLLGSLKANFVRDKDEIIVNGNNRYTAIRFRVEQKDVHIRDLSIYFQNGDKLQPSINEDLGTNSDSRVIELDRDGRAINRIEFRYRTVGSVVKGRARVYVFGKRYQE